MNVAPLDSYEGAPPASHRPEETGRGRRIDGPAQIHMRRRELPSDEPDMMRQPTSFETPAVIIHTARRFEFRHERRTGGSPAPDAMRAKQAIGRRRPDHDPVGIGRGPHTNQNRATGTIIRGPQRSAARSRRDLKSLGIVGQIYDVVNVPRIDRSVIVAAAVRIKRVAYRLLRFGTRQASVGGAELHRLAVR